MHAVLIREISAHPNSRLDDENSLVYLLFLIMYWKKEKMKWQWGRAKDRRKHDWPGGSVCRTCRTRDSFWWRFQRHPSSSDFRSVTCATATQTQNKMTSSKHTKQQVTCFGWTHVVHATQITHDSFWTSYHIFNVAAETILTKSEAGTT